MDIVTHPYNNSLVIFIHGVMSNQYLAWKPVIDLLQNIRQANATIRSYDFCTLHYDSGRFYQPSITRYFNDLSALIARPRYDSVVLIGHSQGGILAKLFVIDQLLANRGKELKVDMVITVDTPHKGPQPWVYPAVLVGGILEAVPLVRKLSILRQTAEMSRWSDNLKRLKEHWTTKMIAPSACIPTHNRRYIRSLSVSGPPLPVFKFKLVVPKRSAHGFEIDEPIRVSPAWGLGHGVASMLEDCRPHIEAELTNLGDAEYFALRRSFLNMPSTDVADALNNLEPGLGASECEVVCWQRRLTAFEIKPLRNLNLEAAVRKFIDLRLQNP